MSGKIIASLIVIVSLLFGAVVYYTQVYYYYDDVAANGTTDVMLTPVGSDTPEAIPYADFQAIDANSSPIRYRACFTTSLSLATLSESYQPYEKAVPRNAPGWFDCFDADVIGAKLEAGEALAFTVERNIEFGIDRVAAITETGQGYVWEEVNDCGDKAYDGSPLGEDCPERN